MVDFNLKVESLVKELTESLDKNSPKTSCVYNDPEVNPPSRSEQQARKEAKETSDNSETDCTFLDVPDYMKCNIVCYNVYEAPQLLTCCGKSICKQCIHSHLQRAAISVDQKPPCIPCLP